MFFNCFYRVVRKMLRININFLFYVLMDNVFIILLGIFAKKWDAFLWRRCNTCINIHKPPEPTVIENKAAGFAGSFSWNILQYLWQICFCHQRCQNGVLSALVSILRVRKNRKEQGERMSTVMINEPWVVSLVSHNHYKFTTNVILPTAYQ